MLFIVLKKMLRNKWMILCLLAGSIIAVAMISSVPMYTSGILQRMLTKDLENFQTESAYYPGSYLVGQDIGLQYTTEYRTKAYISTNDRINKRFVPEFGLPIVTRSQILTLDYLKALRTAAETDVSGDNTEKDRFIKLEAVSNIENKIKMIYGDPPSGTEQNGVIDVMITEEAMKKLDLVVGNEYEITNYSETLDRIKVRVTGAFTVADAADVFWFQGLDPYAGSMIMNYDLFNKRFIDTGSDLISSAKWYYAFDYTKITIDNLDGILGAYKEQTLWKAENRSISLELSAVNILEQYRDRRDNLVTTLWVLQVPILIMLLFYMYIVSKLSIDFEKNEISVMQSRGAGRFWIFGSYLLESLILSVIALIPGIFIGYFLCKFLGASNGFLEFIQRTALIIKVNNTAVTYSVIISLISVLAMVIPAFVASKSNILEFKRKKSRFSDIPAWKKFFIDFILLGISAYGLYTYQLRQETLSLTGIESSEITIDPILFLSSTFFVLGAGLLFLRLYPFLVNLIFIIGKKLWSPSIYASFIQVARTKGQEQFLMLFLILSISIGIFNANTARTINSNNEDKVRYQNGADISLMAEWGSNVPRDDLGPYSGMTDDTGSILTEPVIYTEPDFNLFEDLNGVEYAAKVLRKADIGVETNEGTVNNATLMGITPNQFGKVAWFRNGLLPAHWYYYLNLLSAEPTAMLLSTTFRDNYDVEVGDIISISLDSDSSIEGVVYAFVDFWPTFNPFKQGLNNSPGYLAVANLSYIFARTDVEPYEVWLKKSPGATSEQIYTDMENKGLKIMELNDAEAKVIAFKNDPKFQGTNGSLTLGFVVAMGISILGFLIYWILSIKKRVLQFGIFRAIGMPKSDILKMLILEQVLVSGVAILIGIIIGGISSDLFIPLLNLTQSAAEQVPPFKVIAKAGDYIKVYVFAGALLTLGMVILGVITSRIKIHQVIKLGED